MRPLIAALLLLSLPASAETLHDDASGLSITAPPGYTASLSPARSGANSSSPNRPVFDIRTARDTDTGCRVAVMTVPANTGHTQEQINAAAGSDAYRDQFAATLALLYTVRAIEPVRHSGITGLAAVGDFLPREGMPARAQAVRSFLVVLETPRQRVSLGCVGERRDFEQRLPQFEAVLRGLTIPR